MVEWFLFTTVPMRWYVYFQVSRAYTYTICLAVTLSLSRNGDRIESSCRPQTLSESATAARIRLRELEGKPIVCCRC